MNDASRLPLTIEDSAQDLIDRMAEGDEQAERIAKKMLGHKTPMGAYALVKMGGKKEDGGRNVRGGQLVAALDYCAGSIEQLVSTVHSRDKQTVQGLIHYINEQCPGNVAAIGINFPN
ncbi:MAG: hypothetical protein V1746_04315 [bacterium]